MAIVDRFLCTVLFPGLNLAAMLAAVFVDTTLLLFNRQLNPILALALIELALFTTTILTVEFSGVRTIMGHYKQLFESHHVMSMGEGNVSSMKPPNFSMSSFVIETASGLLVISLIMDIVILNSYCSNIVESIKSPYK